MNDYKFIIGEKEIKEIEELASHSKGTKILHINSTMYGGGVAEILQNLIPLARSVGLNVSREVIQGSEEFFNVTKSFHNALQGMPLELTKEMIETYLHYNALNAERINFDADVIIAHDPQPAALINYHKPGQEKWLWRCHIDLTKPNMTYWALLQPFVKKYVGLIFSLRKYVPYQLLQKKVYIMTPSIDPLADKNRPIEPEFKLETLEKYSVNPDKPIITQISRFDPWKDPLGVMEAYKIVKTKIPEAQLLLIGSMATDDPEGAEWYNKVVEKAKNDPDIHVLTNLNDLEINAVQRASTVIVQKSIREGFGITVTEALWKGTPVVATKVGGIPLQVIDGTTGFLVEGIKDTAEKITMLIKRPFLGRRFGAEGKEHIRRNFLITRHLKDYLRLQLQI
ncbi:MAG: glycosyltransferase [Candidatus Bathyarchaeota archaeon]